MMLRYSKVKREKIGPCNICKKKSKLTWDHVPPQGGIELKPVEIENVLNRMVADEKDRAYTISQNGVRFRTICADCNNSWLGTKYDPRLNDFSLTIGKLVQGKIPLPPVIHVQAWPVAIMRAILGHLLAAKTNIDSVTSDNKIRDFFFDEELPIPESINIFYWIYPYSSIVLLRDFAMPAVRGRFDESGVFNVIKYFPIAYLITDRPSYEGLQELTVFRHLKPTEYSEISIPLREIKHPEWPEIVEDGNFLITSKGSESSIYAIPKKKKA